MARRKKSDSVANWIGPYAVIPGKDAKSYEKLHDLLVRQEIPNDLIDELLIKDIADNQWELLRLRRLSAEAFAVIRPAAVAKLLGFHALEFADDYARESGQDYELYTRKLRDKSLTEDAIMASALLLETAFFDGLDRRMAAAELRRGHALDRLQERRQIRERIKSEQRTKPPLIEPPYPPIAKW